MTETKIQNFIISRLQQLDQQYTLSNDPMEMLKLAVTSVSFSHILSQYMGQNSHTFNSLIKLSETYLKNECYSQAIINARLAKKSIQTSKSNEDQNNKAMLLIAECMIKQGKYDDAKQILIQLEINTENNNKCLQKYYELLVKVYSSIKDEIKMVQILDKLNCLIKSKFGQKSIEYGFHLVEKGKCLGQFNKFSQAIDNISQGIDTLIEKRCKQKKKIGEFYLILANYYRKSNNFQKQFSSLVCAQSMIKQLQDSNKEIISVIHLISNNLVERQQYSKAIKELKRAEAMQKEIYGESSTQLSKTVKKIIEVLDKMNMKSESKKYELEYSRVINSTVLKQKNVN